MEIVVKWASFLVSFQMVLLEGPAYQCAYHLLETELAWHLLKLQAPDFVAMQLSYWDAFAAELPSLTAEAVSKVCDHQP